MSNVLVFEQPNMLVGLFQANIDMSVEATYQFSAVRVLAATGAGLSGTALDNPAAGGNILGIIQNNPQLGEAGTVMVQGISKAKIAGTVAVGDLLMTNASGKLLVATSTNFAVAQALTAGVSGDVISVLVKSYGKQ